MPPSRGLWPAGRIVNGISRRSIGVQANVRTLSSASLVRQHQHATRARIAVPSSLSVTGYMVASGKANLSLWPFSSSKSSTTAAPTPTAAPESLPTTSATTPSEALQSAASSVQDTAAAASAQVQSSVQSVLGQPTDASQAIPSESLHDALQNPVLLENITKIGQMKELGLDYGWGPTSVVEWVVEHIHVYAGTPWYGTIILAAIAMRVLMIYPFYRMSNQQAKLQRVHPQIQKHMAEYQAAQVEGDKMAAQIASKKVGIVRQRHGISMGWMFAPILFQGVFGFGAYKLTNAMAALPVPGFETGGIGWLSNLTHADPYFIAPVALAVTVHLMARYSLADATASADPAVAQMTKPLGLYVFPAVMFLVTFWQSAALQLSFLTATIFGTIQNLLFRNARFREAMGMEPLNRPGSGSGSANIPQRTVPGSQEQFTMEAQEQIPVEENPFKGNPFANLNTARALKPSGSAFENGVKYQAPSAADVLAAGLPRKPASPAVVETPKGENFVTRELKNARQGLGTMVDGFTEKGKTMLSNQKKGGDRGRSAKFLEEARRYEEKVRTREEMAKERRGR